MTEFDPLSFFSGEVPRELSFEENSGQFGDRAKQIELELPIAEHEDLYSEEGEEDEEGLIHTLDLPALSTSLPREIILTILQLLQLDQETNFGNNGANDTQVKDKEEYLGTKGITIKAFNQVQNWLEANGYVKLSKNLLNVQFSEDFFRYLNKILSSAKFQDDEEIIQLTSLRISENCGRTARPNFQRKILIKNLSMPILLNEPALTSDSLGLKTWGSSLILSELIVNNAERLIKEPVLELGAGTGLAGIAIGLLGHHVMLTDLPDILPNLIRNKELNGINADCAVLDWTKAHEFIEKYGALKYKTIVIADPIYSSEHPYWVVNMMKEFLDPSRDSRILLQLPIRKNYENERELLWKLIDDNGFNVVEENISDGYDDFGKQKFIYKQLKWK